jgi:hypothetical protein
MVFPLAQTIPTLAASKSYLKARSVEMELKIHAVTSAIEDETRRIFQPAWLYVRNIPISLTKRMAQNKDAKIRATTSHHLPKTVYQPGVPQMTITRIHLIESISRQFGS